MFALDSLENQALLARLPSLRALEREATAELIAYLCELDRRRLYTAVACSSLSSYCIERLGYSENEAQVRVGVARLCQRLPQALDELRSGRIHLTGLFLLSGRLTSENADALLAEARGKSRRDLECLLARWFARSDVLPSVTPLPGCPATMLEHGPSAAAPAACTEPEPAPAPKPRVQPLSASSYRVEFTASVALHDKLVKAQNLLGHAIPSGDLAALFERAIEALLEAETKRRFGAGKPRKRRALEPGSRHIPVEVARVVWERDGGQCTYLDSEGRRCSEQRFVTLEHIDPHAFGGPATVENLSLLCSSHNALRARQVFGEDQIRKKIAEATEKQQSPDTPRDDPWKSLARGDPWTTLGSARRGKSQKWDESSEKIQAALVRLGFRTAKARRAVEQARARGVEPGLEPLLRAALAELTPTVSPARC